MQTDIAVLGGGFSAAAVTVQLLERLEPGRNILVLADSAQFGLGLAYGTNNPDHRLNVPAGRMSMFADRPDHLLGWLTAQGLGFGPEDFIPRQVYGRYLRDCVQDAMKRNANRSRIDFVDARVLDLQCPANGRQHIRLSNGSQIEAAISIMCLGATPAELPLPLDRLTVPDRFVVADPWTGDWAQRVESGQTVVLLGSGLTMVDQLMTLTGRGHRGRVHVLSRRGLLPQVHHVPRSEALEPMLAPGRLGLSAMMAHLRRQARDTVDWRSAIDGLRPVTQAIWQGLSTEERKRFLRHAAPLWNIHRHRMAPDIHDRIETMRRSGQLVVHAGRLDRIEPDADRIALSFGARGSGMPVTLAADLVVNCTGLDRCAIGRMPILSAIVARGLATSDELGLGVAVDERSRIVDPSGAGRDGLYAVGPMTMGRFWEIVAVPDIRKQVQDVVADIVAAR